MGIATETMVAAAEGQDTASSEALAAAREALDKTYVTLDAKLGLSPGDRPVLTGQLTFSPFKVDSLDAEVSKALSSGNAIVTAPVTVNNTEVISESTLGDLKNTVSLEQLEVNYPWTIGSTGAAYEDTDETGPEMDAAQQTLDSATDSLQTQVRGMNNDIMSLEANYTALQSGLQTAQDNLHDIQVAYTLGLTTQDKVTAAEAACADIQSDITGVIFDHEVLKANFHWLTGEPVVSDPNLAA
jgi:outer membrane protein TolC